MLHKKIIACVLSLLSTTAYADPWKIEIAPYLWAMNMNGTVGVGSRSAHIKESFSDIMKQFQGGGMLFLDAKKDRFGLFFNAVYAELSKNSPLDTPLGPITIHSKNKFGIFSAGISYEVYKNIFANCNETAIDLYAGARYTLNNTTLNVLGLSVSNNQNWTDPIIGGRLRFIFNKAWHAMLSGDVGGTNFNNQKSYNLIGLIGYKPQTMMKNTTFYLGYRLLHQKYINGSGTNRFVWNMNLFGPMAGVAFEF